MNTCNFGIRRHIASYYGSGSDECPRANCHSGKYHCAGPNPRTIAYGYGPCFELTHAGRCRPKLVVAGDEDSMMPNTHMCTNMNWSIEFDEAWCIYECVLPNMQMGIDVTISTQFESTGNVRFATDVETAPAVDHTAQVTHGAVWDQSEQDLCDP